VDWLGDCWRLRQAAGAGRRRRPTSGGFGKQVMSDPRSANNDPSMDDILASIRKIISDDEARAQVNSQQAAPPVRPIVRRVAAGATRRRWP